MTTAIVFVQNEPRLTRNGDWLPDDDTFRLERSASQCKAPRQTFTRLEITLDDDAEKALAEVDFDRVHKTKNEAMLSQVAREWILREQVQRQEIERLVKAAKAYVVHPDYLGNQTELDAALKAIGETK